MLFPLSSLGVTFALVSAAVWGGGDFAGGYATRSRNPFQVLAVSAVTGLLIFSAAALVWRESFPSPRGILWAVLAGVTGTLSIAAFYRALATGHNASVAPTAAVIGAGLPVIFAALTEGLPAPSRLLGFALALVGIWLVSAGPSTAARLARPTLFLTLAAGIGFATFFICIGQVDRGKIFTPLVIARILTLLISLFFLRQYRLPLPGLASNLLPLIAGVLDAGGNLFFILARQYTRLDIAVVLASLYPATTVILASTLLKEKVSLSQGAGVLFCLAAIALISI